MAEHRKRKSFIRRARHYISRRKWIIPAAVLAVVAVIAAAVLVLADRQNQENYKVSAEASGNVGSGYRDIIWNNKHYRYNNRITAILLAGLDSEGEIKETKSYAMAPRADSIQLLIIDGKTHKTHILGLNRNTITKIRKYALNGKNRGLMRDQLCLAYTYGNGGKVSCESLCEAVSILLYDIPIKSYMVVNRTSLEKVAEIVGPVEVTVPNDDLVEDDPAYYEGATVTIDASNLEFYIRSRDIEVSHSNLGRMERQKSYINAAMESMMARISDDPSALWDDIVQLEGCMLTNITRSRYLELASQLKDTEYSASDYVTLEGTMSEDSYYDEFYPDQEKVLEFVVDTFYMEQ